MIYLLYTLHVMVCVFLILVVLLQQGKGADLSVFGGGSTQTAFGARGATTFLHKLTVASFIIFVLTTLAIGIPQLGGGGSVVRGAGAGKTKSAAGKPAVPRPPQAPQAPQAPKAAPAPGAPHQGAAPGQTPPPGANPAAPKPPSRGTSR